MKGYGEKTSYPFAFISEFINSLLNALAMAAINYIVVFKSIVIGIIILNAFVLRNIYPHSRANPITYRIATTGVTNAAIINHS